MSFEAFLGESAPPARSGLRRRLILTLSIAVHGALVAAGIAYSFWHVEELKPPSVDVTFMSTAPPPPPAAVAAALGNGGAVVKRKIFAPKPRITPPAPQPSLTAPPLEPKVATTEEKPKSEPLPVTKQDGAGLGRPDGRAGGNVHGVVGGNLHGTVGGMVGGTGAPGTSPPKFLPPSLGALQKLTGADPEFPSVLRRPGAAYLVMAKICVSTAGGVDNVSILRKADPLLDVGVASTVRTWKFRPLQANGTPVPFCYFGRFEFKAN